MLSKDLRNLYKKVASRVSHLRLEAGLLCNFSRTVLLTQDALLARNDFTLVLH